MNQLSTPMPIQSLRASRITRSSRLRHSTMRRWENSCCLTMWSVPRRHMMRSCWLSCKAPMKQRQHVPNGIGMHWSVSEVEYGYQPFLQLFYLQMDYYFIYTPRDQILFL